MTAAGSVRSPRVVCGHISDRGQGERRPITTAAGTVSQRAVTRERRDQVLKLRLDADLLRRLDALAGMIDDEAGDYVRRHYLPPRRITRSAAVRSVLAAVLAQVEDGRAAPILTEAVQHALLRHD